MNYTIEECILKGLAKETINFIKSLKSNEKHHKIIMKRLMNKETSYDDVVLLFMKKPLLIPSLINEGFNKYTLWDTGSPLRITLINSFINLLVQEWRNGHNRETFMNRLKLIEPDEIEVEDIQKTEFEMSCNIDVFKMSKLWNDHLMSQKDANGKLDEGKILRDKLVWDYIIYPGESKDKNLFMKSACKKIGIKERMFAYDVKEMKSRVQYFFSNISCEMDHFQTDLDVDAIIRSE